MKKSAILCAALALALAISIGAQFVSKAWLDTTFMAAESVTITIGDRNYELPLIAHTSVRYKTSDSSYVLVSRGRLTDVENFYRELYGAESSDGKLTFVTDFGVSFTVERLTDDLNYVEYGVGTI